MKAFVGLAAEFIDKLANPAHGVETNEAYGARLASLEQGDSRFGEQFAAACEELQADDLHLLGTSGWIWLLGWLASRSRRPPDAILDALYDETQDVVVRLRIVEAVTTFPPTIERFTVLRRRTTPLSEVPDRWLARRLVSLVEPGVNRVDPSALAATQEFTLLLLQVGNEVALSTARSLLAHHWPGGEELQASVRALFSRLDGETREAWLRMLGLEGSPPR